MSMEKLSVGDHVTVRISDTDPLELCLHRHAVITEVRQVDNDADDTSYMVGHPWGSTRRYGPYREDRLIRGWCTP